MLRTWRGLAGGVFVFSTAAFATTIDLKPLEAVNVEPHAVEVLQLLVRSAAERHGTLAAEGEKAEETLSVLALGLGDGQHPPYLLHFTRVRGQTAQQLELFGSEMLHAVFSFYFVGFKVDFDIP